MYIYDILVHESMKATRKSMFVAYIDFLQQGCLLSPLLFSLFINDMVRKVNALRRGVPLGPYEQISILLYADDIALIAESEENLQDMLDLLGAWCQEWGLKVNPKKSEIIHFPNPSVPKSPFQFPCGNLELRVVIKYRYLGYGLINTYQGYSFRGG